ncbi:sulfatase [Pelagicoccus mobilis]|uniref:Sulfatase n=1 Tax=Pelagicoccus mobilis TaxID=415221 RepID=A0A934VRP0_9BACT|nr:sulfatase [Pelagicoccus mobilis]MBK1877684.1 sulfatase [Pelagicoccus mobilis]
MNKSLACATTFLILHLLSFATAKPLNMLFIVSDDLSVNALAEAATPHIDRLVQESMTFTKAYCQYPACAPSRNSFLSGTRPDRTQAQWSRLRDLMPDVTTLPQLCRENGYFTASIGKIFHIGNWDRRWPESDWKMGDPECWDFRINCPPSNQGRQSKPPFPRKGEKFTFPGLSGPIDYGMISYESDLAQDDGQVTQEAIRQLDRPREKPFFLGVGYRRPHAPFVAPEKYFWPYPESSIELPSPGDRSDAPSFAFNTRKANYEDPDSMKRMKMCYLASVSFLDAQIGRLIQFLEEHDLYEDTAIILFSDHGFQLGEHGDWHKNTLFEESLQVPLIIRIPSITTPGSSSETPVALVDLYPTLQELLKLPYPKHKLDGFSLLPQIRDPNQFGAARPIFSQIRRNTTKHGSIVAYSVRTDRYRYNEWWTSERAPEILATELYDLEEDPNSETNLASDSGFIETTQHLSQLIRNYRKL